MTEREWACWLVNRERDRAERLKASGKLRWTSADRDCPTHMWLAALTEELGEVGRCVHDGSTDEELICELAQLAGIAVGRIEAMLA
jgi:hypothetical protein